MLRIVSLDLINEYITILLNDIIHWWWWYITEISWQFLIAIIAYVCACLFLYIILKQVDQQAWQLPGPPSRLLLVTAHPDDEVMFFGPIIYYTSRANSSQIYLLCLTMG
jgi:N-acetylglucosaminylphosphatidylinositol deacetylase